LLGWVRPEPDGKVGSKALKTWEQKMGIRQITFFWSIVLVFHFHVSFYLLQMVFIVFYIRSRDHRNSPLEPGLCSIHVYIWDRFYCASNVLSMWLLSFIVRAKYRLYGKMINAIICMSGWKEVGSVTNVAKCLAV
jgi:hypothetical protein